MGHNSRFFAATSRFCAKWAWLVIGFWVALAGILNVAIPQLEQTVAEHSAPFMPANIKAAQTLREMSDAFGVPRSSAVGSVVLVDEHGIDAARLEAHGFGETRPVADNNAPAGRAANRRVEIQLSPLT